ncbi:MAG TPA: pitrilysin family protein [Candidatus Megaira endosymbiont of Nemacystus decipiens]|nr:pitrilysin family protein [Candidatus Megaera endosymbiont of Nemacystus decipiens]
MTFNHSITSNGINLVTYNMPHVNSVSINIVVNVGSRYETAKTQGISHFLEHMAFKGTKKRTALQIAKEFDEIGGYFNAYTSRENTVYFSKVLHQHFYNSIEILSDILQNSIFEASEVKKELDVIVQEIAEVQDNPDDLVSEKLFEIAYPSQPLGRSILGTYETIKNFNTADFQNYINEHYSTDNIVISIAGKINHDTALEIIEKLFSSLKKSQIKTTYGLANYNGGEYFIEKKLEQTTVIMGFESPAYTDVQEFYHAQILSIIFGGGLSSRLFQKIREELGLAYSVGTWQNSFRDSGIFGISASCEHAKAKELVANIENEIVKLQEFISDNELDRAKSLVESNIYMADEKPEYKSEEIGKTFSLLKKYYSSEEVISSIHATSTEDLRKVASKIFSTPQTKIVAGIK